LTPLCRYWWVFRNEFDIAEEKGAAQIGSVVMSMVSVVGAGTRAPVRLLAFEREFDDERRIEWRSH
jgi:hypothetical protein